MKFGVDIRQRAHGHRLREPAERRLHVHRRHRRAHRQRRGRFPARPAGAVPPRDAEHRRRTATAGSTPAYVQDEFRPVAERHASNAGLRYELPMPFVDVNDALNSFRPGPAVDAVPARRRSASSIPGDAGVPRGTYETDKNNFAPRLGVVWDPTGTGRVEPARRRGASSTTRWPVRATSSRTACSRRRSRRSLEVNSPPARADARAIRSASVSGGAGRLPARADLHRLGHGLPDAVRAALQPDVAAAGRRRLSAPRSATSDRAASNLPIFMEVNPGLYAPGQTTPGRAALSRRSRWCGRRSRSRESWYDSLQASLRMRPDARHELPRVLHATATPSTTCRA